MRNKIRILFTIPNFNTAGSKYVLLSILNHLNTKKFEPYVGVEKFAESVPEDIPPSRAVFMPQTGDFKTDVLALRKLLKRHQIDIVHSWDYKSNFVEATACGISGVKYLYTKKNNAWSKRWQLKSMLSSHIAYDNPEMKYRFFKAFYFNKKTSFIPHGVDLKQFYPQEKTIRNTFNLCCIGNIGANKNQLFILEALTQLPDHVHLYLYGKEDPDYRMQLDAFITEHALVQRVHFKGYVHNTEIAAIHKTQDVFVLASHQEGFPVCLLEAMACGIPVLSSNSGGGAAYMLGQNQGGFIFDLNSPDTLVRHIRKLKDDKNYYADCATKGIANVSTRFTITKEVAAYELLYSKVFNIRKH